MRQTVKKRAVFFVLAGMAAVAVFDRSCAAAEPGAPASPRWTQWGGPQRNFVANTDGLADRWPESGPRQLWKREMGDGYGTILAEGDTLYAMYRAGEHESTIALDAATGVTRWEHKIASPTTPLMEEFSPGPSATPLIVSDRLYSVGVNMMLHCFDKKTGAVRWKHDLVSEFSATVPGRGYTCSPVAYKDTIILPVGGEDKEGQSLMAFDQKTGEVVWKSLSFTITHSSPIVITFNGSDQLVYFAGAEIVGVDPESGALLWSHPHQTQYSANISTPVFDGEDLIFCSAAYDSGARVIRLSVQEGKTVPEEICYSRKMRLHHGNAVVLGDHVYGSSGDFGPAFFMAMNLKTGEIAWRQRGFKKATCVYGDGKMVILDEDGNLALATVSPAGLTLRSRTKIAEPYAWAAPTLVGTRLYVRDRKHIMAFDLG